MCMLPILAPCCARVKAKLRAVINSDLLLRSAYQYARILFTQPIRGGQQANTTVRARRFPTHFFRRLAV